ncbi:MAG: hypothetical protein SPM04_04415, partial [Lachnospira sp.]|nr:hypothetical protein [Lachnospira sp.]
ATFRCFGGSNIKKYYYKQPWIGFFYNCPGDQKIIYYINNNPLDIFDEKQQIGGYMTNSIKNGKLIINGEDVYELDEDCLIRSGVKPVS